MAVCACMEGGNTQYAMLVFICRLLQRFLEKKPHRSKFVQCFFLVCVLEILKRFICHFAQFSRIFVHFWAVWCAVFGVFLVRSFGCFCASSVQHPFGNTFCTPSSYAHSRSAPAAPVLADCAAGCARGCGLGGQASAFRVPSTTHKGGGVDGSQSKFGQW